MDYISVKAVSEQWGISERRIQKLCEEWYIKIWSSMDDTKGCSKAE